jgi:hypothetical protein
MVVIIRKYDFTIVYRPSKTCVVAYALLRLLNIIEPISVPNQTTNATFFYIEPKLLNDVK